MAVDEPESPRQNLQDVAIVAGLLGFVLVLLVWGVLPALLPPGEPRIIVYFSPGADNLNVVGREVTITDKVTGAKQRFRIPQNFRVVFPNLTAGREYSIAMVTPEGELELWSGQLEGQFKTFNLPLKPPPS